MVFEIIIWLKFSGGILQLARNFLGCEDTRPSIDNRPDNDTRPSIDKRPDQNGTSGSDLISYQWI